MLAVETPVRSATQLGLFGADEAAVVLRDSSSTFADNLSTPVHRWFRYSAGFSGDWAGEVIAREQAAGRQRVLDPFAGSGTVLLEAERRGADGIGLEAHPFVLRVAQAKLRWRESSEEFLRAADRMMATARVGKGDLNGYPDLIRRCYPDETLSGLDALKRAWLGQADGLGSSELAWLALSACLRECSPVGTAQWQYVLPNKSKARALNPLTAFANRVQRMALDMRTVQRRIAFGAAQVYADDARVCANVPTGWAELVLTSPPYANNYDYADATRLEMCFWGEVEGWGGLQKAVRERLVVSCTQHVAATREALETILADDAVAPIHAELRDVCARLSIERESHGGKKPYDRMIAAYFRDLSRVWRALRRACAPGARVCFVIGDSAPYGVHAPVERWLGELAVAAGFHHWSFEKIRDRNVKWKNRKHRVPLQEGRLWVEG
ncbi:MAG: hypothetical protein RLZZ15_488 [Verrucomicrobiota bacterium]|jgi:SAM-dependent methyltransferase